MIVDIIFIDDEEDILNLLKLKFRKFKKFKNLQLKFFEFSKDFENYIRQTSSDGVVIISDINMPDNNVFSALGEERDRFKFVLSYLCSAYSATEFQEMINDNDIKYFFKKPLNIENIKEKLIDDLGNIGVEVEELA